MKWTAKSAVARSRKNLDGAIDRLRAVSHEWDDVDQSFVDEAEEFIRDLQDFRDRIEIETTQRLDAGELVAP